MRRNGNSFKSKTQNDLMKITHSHINPRLRRHAGVFLRRRLNSALGFVVLACFLTAARSSRAEGPAFITTPSTISGITTSTQAQGPLRASADLNQAAVSQIIDQLNQRQLQLSAAAQPSAQRSVFVPQITTIRRANKAETKGILRPRSMPNARGELERFASHIGVQNRAT